MADIYLPSIGITEPVAKRPTMDELKADKQCRRARQMADGLSNSLKIAAPLDRDAVACVIEAAMRWATEQATNG